MEQWPTNHSRRHFLTQLLSRVRTFDVVDDDFSYDESLKIGIVAYNAGSQKDKEAFSEVGGVGGVDGIHVDDTWATRTDGFMKSKFEKVLGGML